MIQRDVVDALRISARTGEFFAFSLAAVDGSTWFALRELLTGTSTLADRVVHVRHELARTNGVADYDVPLRTAASTDLFALAARVLSPALGACCLARTVPVLTPDSVGYRHDAQQLSAAPTAGRTVETARAGAAALRDEVLDTVIAPLVMAFAARFRLSRKVLWGNVASALNGACEVLDAAHVTQVVPVREVLRHVLAESPLRATVRSLPPRFVRNSCCLWYRIPGSTICADCVLGA